ncbi:hypothetical protein ACHAXR_005265 [Thalassiosira sp. AJA248-18]
MASFPVASSVLLQNLVKGAHLNDKKGIVKSRLSATGRQEVYIFEAEKTMAIKPANLRYEPRDLSTLSVSEMKGVLRVSFGFESDKTEWSGMDKEELRQMVKETVTDPLEIAELVAKANEPKEIPSSNNNNANGASFDSSQLRQGADRMSSMTPDDIRRQAATMKAMGPAALRNMNPQMARMSDAQINMAIEQMEAVANNPSQLKMAADQMKNMSESQLQQVVKQSPLANDLPATTTTSPPSSTTATTTPALSNVSKSQFKQATEQLSSMSPDQLKQQAKMLKSMPLDTLRRTNPQMANMTDEQIQMSITQLEQMAENPDMVKMAADQMKNLSEEQYESMKRMVGGVDPGNSTAGGSDTLSANSPAAAGIAGLPTDPSNMMEALLSNPDQLNSVIKTMKQNPEMMKQVMSSQMKSDAQKEQLSKVIDSFAEMDDKQLNRYLTVANGVQKVAKPVMTLFDKVKRTLGVSAKTMVILINLVILASFVLLARWWRGSGGGVVMVEEDVLARSQEEPPEIVAGYADSEF